MIKRLFLLLAVIGMSQMAGAQTDNLFVELGYSPAEVDAKVKEVFKDVFYGPNKIYFEVDDTLGYISEEPRCTNGRYVVRYDDCRSTR